MEEQNNLNAVNDAQEMNVESQSPDKAVTTTQSPKENSAFAAMRKSNQQLKSESDIIRKENKELEMEIESSKESLKELDSLKAYRDTRIIEDDIALIKQTYPDFCTDISDLPSDFIRIMATGMVDALTAAEIIEAKKAKAKKSKPESMGQLSSGTTPIKEFYTPDEVDKISRADLKANPGLLRKIQKSMTKWR